MSGSRSLGKESQGFPIRTIRDYQGLLGHIDLFGKTWLLLHRLQWGLYDCTVAIPASTLTKLEFPSLRPFTQDLREQTLDS